MTITPITGCESTGTHLILARPIVGVGLLICAAAVGGYLQMTGVPDDFGGCGETGGDLYRVVEITENPELVCAIPEEAPVQKEP